MVTVKLVRRNPRVSALRRISTITCFCLVLGFTVVLLQVYNGGLGTQKALHFLLNQDSSYTGVNNAHTQRHAIPNNLIFTHRSNLLTIWIQMRKIVPQVILFLQYHGYDLVPSQWTSSLQDQISDKLLILKKNTMDSIAMHKHSHVLFLTDHECMQLLREHYGPIHGVTMQRHYLSEPGMIRGDICRGLALFKYGGLYMDVDLKCRMSVWPLIRPTTTFVTVWEAGSNDFFQAFIGATPRHPIVKRYLELFLELYQRTLIEPVSDKKGVVLLRMAYEQVVAKQPELVSSIQLWNETKYDLVDFPHIELPPGPQTNIRATNTGLCRYLVFDEHKNVPFWSHVAGSSKYCITYPPSENAI